jgi:hypothetical protein
MRFTWRGTRSGRTRERAEPAPANGQIVVIALFGRCDAVPLHLSNQLRSAGATVYVAHGPDGCLRVATATQPAAIYLDPRLPHSLDRLLQGHPSTANSRILDFDTIEHHPR